MEIPEESEEKIMRFFLPSDLQAFTAAKEGERLITVIKETYYFVAIRGDRPIKAKTVRDLMDALLKLYEIKSLVPKPKPEEEE